MDILTSAIDYANMGLPIFPVSVETKAPLIKGGFYSATTDIDTIEKWWQYNPDAAIAMPTGNKSGLIVMDIDPRNGGDYGLNELIGKFGDIPDTAICLTGGGGMHYYFRYPDIPTKCSSGKLASGIDIKADGGYVILPPSYHKSGNQYHWDGDFSLDDIANLPNWLLRLITEDKKNNIVSSINTNEIPAGQRNNTLASIAGTMRRIGMSEQEILTALEVVNQNRCKPPLPKDEVVRIAKSISRYEPDMVSVAIMENHYEQMFSHENKSSDIIDPGPIPNELLRVPGFIGKVIDYNLQTAIRPQPILALAGAIQLQAVLAARKVCDELDNRTNLYVIGVAPSGAGKDHARLINRQILTEAGLDDYEGNDEVASDSGLLSAVEMHPAILFQFDEFGRFLRTIGDPKKAPHLYNIISALMKLYSSANTNFKGKAYADPKRNKKIYRPCVCLYATTVPENLYQSITIDSLSDGFYARLLIFNVNELPVRQRGPRRKVPTDIIDIAKFWEQFNPSGNLQKEYPEPLEIKSTPDALDIFNEFARQVDMELDKKNIYSALWARAEEKACRLALIYACSANHEKPIIDASAATWACRLSEHITKQMVFIAHRWVSDGYFDEKQKKVIRVIEKAGGRISKTDLGERTRSLNKKERKDIIENLIETGVIREEISQSLTNRGTYYVLL